MKGCSICPICGREVYAPDKFQKDYYYCYPQYGGCGKRFPTKLIKINGIYSHILPVNEYLKKEIMAFFHDFYIPTNRRGSGFSNEILKIKSDADDQIIERMSGLIAKDLDIIIGYCEDYRQHKPIVVTVPRSKPDGRWKEKELKFRPAVSQAVEQSAWAEEKSGKKWLNDGVHYLQRVKPTQTTHIAHKNYEWNNGPTPYSGITRDTCLLKGAIKGRRIILVDDIYTRNVGVVEDCIQFILDSGAVNVILYTLGMTWHFNS